MDYGRIKDVVVDIMRCRGYKLQPETTKVGKLPIWACFCLDEDNKMNVFDETVPAPSRIAKHAETVHVLLSTQTAEDVPGAVFTGVSKKELSVHHIRTVLELMFSVKKKSAASSKSKTKQKIDYSGKEPPIQHLIWICQGISSKSRVELELGGRCVVESFNPYTLVLNILRHEAVPHHILLCPATNRETILNVFKTAGSKNALAMLYTDDPVSKIYNFPAGHIVRIDRKSSLHTTVPFYRRVVEGDLLVVNYKNEGVGADEDEDND